MKKVILLFVLALLGIVQVTNGQVVEDWVKLYEPYIYNGMPYRLMKPINFNPRRKYPVIVSLHGGGGKGSDNLKQLRDWNKVLTEEQRRIEYPSYVLAPRQRECGIQHTFKTSRILSRICRRLT